MTSNFNKTNVSSSNSNLRVLICYAGNSSKEGFLNLIKSLNNLTNSCIRVVVSSEVSRAVFEDPSIIKLLDKIYTDEDEWTQWHKVGDPVLHIELTKWADIVLLSPVDLNTISKIAIGICEDLLTCTLRAWNPVKPLFFYPIIPVSTSSLGQKHLEILKSWGYKEISPSCISKESSVNLQENVTVDSIEIANKIMLLVGNQDE